jgi:hypothetical protein
MTMLEAEAQFDAEHSDTDSDNEDVVDSGVDADVCTLTRVLGKWLFASPTCILTRVLGKWLFASPTCILTRVSGKWLFASPTELCLRYAYVLCC